MEYTLHLEAEPGLFRQLEDWLVKHRIAYKIDTETDTSAWGDVPQEVIDGIAESIEQEKRGEVITLEEFREENAAFLRSLTAK